MEMKDKLYKTHHKKGFYALRQCSIFTLAAISLCAFVSIPTYITMQNHANNKADAQVEHSLTDQQIDIEKYISYGVK